MGTAAKLAPLPPGHIAAPQPAKELRGHPSVAVLGIPVDNVDLAGALARIDTFVESGHFHQVATANADFLVNARRNRRLQEILSECDLVLADGMPLVWASRVMGSPLPERVAGVDLVLALAQRSAQRGYRVFLLGASPESSAAVAAHLTAEFPELNICGRLSPPVTPLEQMDDRAILDAIEKARPDILLVAFGNPKQELWIHRNRKRLKTAVAIGVGGTFDLLGGSLPRAPRWMQNHGLEWMFRLLQEPKRLARRYAADAWGLATSLSVQLCAFVAQRRGGGEHPAAIRTGSKLVLKPAGDFTGAVTAAVETEARARLSGGSHVLVDLSDVTFLGIDAAGSLIRLYRLACEKGCALMLVNPRPPVARLLRAAQMETMIRTAVDVESALEGFVPAR